MKPAPTDHAERLRAIWTKNGVSPQRQALILAQIARKGAPGAAVGPFRLPGQEQLTLELEPLYQGDATPCK